MAPVTAEKGQGKVVLLGTSNSRRLRDTGFGFEQVLSRALNREVVTFLEDGGTLEQAPLALQKSGFEFNPGDILVFEFPMESTLAPAPPLPEVRMARGRAVSSLPRKR